MNSQYEQYTIINGRQYRYDPDFDAYYPVQEPPTTASKYGWIAVTLVLAVICYCVEHFR